MALSVMTKRCFVRGLCEGEVGAFVICIIIA